MMKPRLLIALVVGLLVAGFGIYTLTASNTVPTSQAGQGANTIGAYSVTNIDYNLNAANPANLDSVDFDITPTSATDLYVKLQAVGGSWYSCTNTAGAVSCTTAGQTVNAADQFQFVASD